MLDCKSGFHPSEDKLKRNNCHIYVTSIMIITFLMFLLKQSTLSAVIFLFVSLGLSLFCVYYILMLYRNACVVSSNVVSDECDVLDEAALCIQQKCDESALCVQQIDVTREIKYPEEFRSRYAMFVNCNTSFNNREYHVRRRFDRNTSSSVYKNASHRGQCAALNLCNDIETSTKNRGPPIHSIDPTQTIKASYSQGDNMYFGENAGKRCVPMSLSALIYNKIKGIHRCNDLVQIMEMGNQLYSTLSQCTGQVYLI